MMRKLMQFMLAAVLISAAATAAKPAKPLFARSEMIHLTIKAPLASLAKDPAKTETTIAGTLAVTGGAPETLDIALTPRGLTRRKHDICPFPPLRVEFVSKPPQGSLFQGQKKLKLVTHCRPAESFQQYLLLEYAAYRLYNALTPASFAVRLAKIDYVDERGRPITSRLGFFIEAADDMARRNDLHEAKIADRIPIAQLDARAAARFAVFEALISNLDWSMAAGPAGSDCCHNARLIGAEAATAGLIPVPYDFDFSGLVDAPYAVPPGGIEIANVRVRRYRGYCRHNADVSDAVANLLAQRPQLLAVLGDITQLDDRTRSKASAYLDSFFSPAASPADIAAKLVKTCI